MDKIVSLYGPLAGRVLLSLIFLMSAFGKIGNFGGTAGYMASKGMPVPSFFLVGAIVFLIVGGLSVLLGFRARIGAILLAIFLVAATLIFHNFWAAPAEQQQQEMISFLKNLSILGGLVTIMAHGSGPLSLDRVLGAKA